MYIIPKIQATPIETYQNQGPNINPIKHEYHTSAKPSFLLDMKNESKNINRPITAPIIENHMFILDTTNSGRKIINAKMKAIRGIIPSFISVIDINTEKIMNMFFIIISRTIFILYLLCFYKANLNKETIKKRIDKEREGRT